MTVTEIRPRSAEQVTREAALQLGFAWHCTKSGTEGECDEAGNDRAEYAAHMKGHGLRQIHGVRKIKLKRTPPGAMIGKLDVPPLKWLHWDETHSEPGTCTCGHSALAHGSRMWPGEATGCGECVCGQDRYAVEPVRTTVRRRGQLWSRSSSAHSYWVLPFEPAPWESGRAAPVDLHVSQFIR